MECTEDDDNDTGRMFVAGMAFCSTMGAIMGVVAGYFIWGGGCI